VANDIGGAFDFAQTATAGIERIEVMRQSNSVMYGTDALAGVVNITTRRGRTRIPQVDLSADGGNFKTRRGSAAVGGAIKRVDYFSEYAYFNTDNSTPNNAYRNGTYAGRFGIAVAHGTDLSGTIRRVDTRPTIRSRRTRSITPASPRNRSTTIAGRAPSGSATPTSETTTRTHHRRGSGSIRSALVRTIWARR